MERYECCQSGAVGFPREVFNRPGLSAISYRLGAFADFRRELLESRAFLELKLNDHRCRPLDKWTASAGGDFGMLTFEMWAYLADVLSFYNERTINEALLRSARLQASILRLAALLGYQPAPGVAATALLVFEIERDQRLVLPLGLQVQSVPDPDKKPQKFETAEALRVDARLNRVRVFPPPIGREPFRPNHFEALLDPRIQYAPPLAPGQTLVLFNTGSSVVTEDKRIESVSELVEGRRLRWTPPVQDIPLDVSPRLFRYLRKLRLFGINAPEKYLVGDPGANPLELTWKSVLTEFKVNIPALSLFSLLLDGVYEDLRVGQRILVSTPGFNILTDIVEITQEPATVGPLAATVTKIGCSVAFGERYQGVPDALDLRRVIVYVLDQSEIQCLKYVYPESIDGTQVLLPLENVEDLMPGRRLILDDQTHQPLAAKIVEVSPAVTPAQGYVNVTLDTSLGTELARTLETATAIVLGNVASAVHGEKVMNEILGDGDAGRPFARLRLAKAPVTHVPAAGAPHGAASTLKLRVDNVLWHEVPTLYGRGPDERVFTTARDDDQVVTICGGDGVNGARFTTGRANLVANYRVGLGVSGNVNADTLRTLLDRPGGLKGVCNPLPAEGGADPETMDQTRTNAPNTVCTFGRIVSLQDFEDAAREYASVTKAAAAWEWDGEEQCVKLIVVGVNGTIIAPETRRNLTDDLNARRDPRVKLAVVPHTLAPVRIGAGILVHTDYPPEQTCSAVWQALRDRFDFDRVKLGSSIHLSDVYSWVQRVEGVVAVNVNRLCFKCPHKMFLLDKGATGAAVQFRLRLHPNELPCIQDPVTDLIITQGLT